MAFLCTFSFFPRSRLVVHATCSVTHIAKAQQTIYMNLGEARFAGETVRESHKLRSRITRSNTSTRAVLFFSCDCLMASMARSVECFNPKSRHCTGPFNWGGAHCAGEKMKRKTGPFLQKSHQKQANSKQGTARHGNQEPPGQAPRYTGQEANNTTPRDFEHRSRYALTYIEVFRSMFRSNNVQRLIPHCM